MRLRSRRHSTAEQELSTAHLVPDLARRSLRGGAVTIGAQALKMVLQFAAVIVLTRLLPPAAFGMVAMAAALYAALEVLKELGLSAATIQKPDLKQAEVSALFWMNTSAGAVIALALFLAAPLIAAFYGQPELVEITRWLALGFLMSGLTVQHWALLRRQMRFGAIAVMETGAEMIGLAAGIALAVSGADYWALVVQRLTGPGLTMVGCWLLCRWRPSAPALVPGMGQLVLFGASVMGSNVAAAITRNLDQVMIGWLWGAAWLGIYERATRLLLLPLNNLNGPIYAVAMPMLSRLVGQHERYRSAFREIIEKLAMLTAPAGALLAVTCDWVVELLFGHGWSAATPVVAAFAVAVAWLPIVYALNLLYLSQNRPKEMLRAAAVDSALSVALILAGVSFGPAAIALCYAVGGLFLRLPMSLWLATRKGPVSLHDAVAAVLPSFAAAPCVAGAVWLLRQEVAWDFATTAGRLLIVAIAAVVAAMVAYYAIPQSRRALMMLARLPRMMRRDPAVNT
ncbi:MAG TPA: lipopolysaccharide biosynthesis protein [Alphaproteobacteria bacterium]